MNGWKKSTSGFMIVVLMTAGLPATAFAQDGGDGGDGAIGDFPDPTTTDLPRNNVTGSAVSGRAPGNWIRSAASRYGLFHSRAIDEFGGVEYSQQPEPRRRHTFLLTFIPQAFAIINELILAYIAAAQAGQTPTTQPAG